MLAAFMMRYSLNLFSYILYIIYIKRFPYWSIYFLAINWTPIPIAVDLDSDPSVPKIHWIPIHSPIFECSL